MKTFLLLTLTFGAFIARAQKTETYYDYTWKPSEVSYARFLSVVEPTADSLWQRHDYYIRERQLQMKGIYKDEATKLKHGFFTFYHTNGQPSSFGQYVNNKKQGPWLSYHSNGMMDDSAVYENGSIRGTQLGWFPNGNMSDSNVYDGDGNAVRVHWFINGQLSSAGRIVNKKQNGKWQYFHNNGKLSAEETYEAGKTTSRSYYDEDGNPVSDTTNRDREAVCKQDWASYLEDELYFPAHLKMVNGDKATVLINFTIDEDGKVIDAYVSSSFHPIIDKIALQAVEKSPRWKPAIDHNRRVRAYRRQPLTFRQQEN